MPAACSYFRVTKGDGASGGGGGGREGGGGSEIVTLLLCSLFLSFGKDGESQKSVSLRLPRACFAIPVPSASERR